MMPVGRARKFPRVVVRLSRKVLWQRRPGPGLHRMLHSTCGVWGSYSIQSCCPSIFKYRGCRVIAQPHRCPVISFSVRRVGLSMSMGRRLAVPVDGLSSDPTNGAQKAELKWEPLETNQVRPYMLVDAPKPPPPFFSSCFGPFWRVWRMDLTPMEVRTNRCFYLDTHDI